MKKKLLTIGIPLISGVIIGSIVMHINMVQTVKDTNIMNLSSLAKSYISHIATIYEEGDNNKDLVLRTIDVVNAPEFEEIFNDNVKAFSKEVKARIENQTN